MEPFDEDLEITMRLEQLNSRLDGLEERTVRMSIELEEMKTAVDHLEASFLDEFAKSAKSKFDNFRDYLASKIKP